jgi:hypothetical protein
MSNWDEGDVKQKQRHRAVAAGGSKGVTNRAPVRRVAKFVA